jgi:hypothetical protein
VSDEQLPLAALAQGPGTDHAPPAKPSVPPFVDHLGNAAKRKVGVLGWEWCTSEAIDVGVGADCASCDFLLTGGVQRTLTRGPRKGHRTWKGCDITRVVVTRAELDAELASHEATTGRCHRCDGDGRVVTSVHVNPDKTLATTTGPCGRCSGTGKPPC